MRLVHRLVSSSVYAPSIKRWVVRGIEEISIVGRINRLSLFHGRRKFRIEMKEHPRVETVAIMGASARPERYAHKAMKMLLEYGHRPLPINPAYEAILDQPCYPNLSAAPGPIDTVTLYLSAERSDPLVEEIVRTKPRRIIMNPGAENRSLADRAKDAGIEVMEACTLVLLRTGQF